MRRMPIASLLLALALAVLPPLEQAHCAAMAAERTARSLPGAMDASHACCRDGASAGTRRAASPARAPICQGCQELPSVTLSGGAAGLAGLPAPALVAPLPAPLRAAPAPRAAVIAPAPDVGSPAPPVDPGAHGLRAPPRSA